MIPVYDWDDSDDYQGYICPECASLVSYDHGEIHYKWHEDEVIRLRTILDQIIEGE